MALSFTQPICDEDWARLRSNEPYRMQQPETEVCAWCGRATTSGIYWRVADPIVLPFPATREEMGT